MNMRSRKLIDILREDEMPQKTEPPDLAGRLQRMLNERGLSIAEAARMAGMEKQQCWLIVTGRRDNPEWKTLLKIVEGVGGSMKELFSDEGDE